MRTLCVGPASPIFNALLQLFGSVTPAATVGEAKINGCKVGIRRGCCVKVGKGVGLGVSVGGGGVFVGIAAWVAATIVHAADTAVP